MFYQLVLQEYQEGEFTFICDCSETFKEAWSQVEKWRKINKHAEMYLKEHKLTHTTGRPVLFYIDDRTYDCQPDKIARNLRLHFLEWAIANNLQIQ